MQRQLTGNERFIKAKQKKKDQDARRLRRREKEPLRAKVTRTAKQSLRPSFIMQLMPYAILWIVLTNIGVHATTRIRSTNGKNNKISGSSSRIFRAIQDSCEDATSITTINKPPSLIGAHHGMTDYQSCIDGDVMGCLLEQSRGKQHNPSFDIQSMRYSDYSPNENVVFQQARDADDLQYSVWKERAREDLAQLIDPSSLTMQELDQVNSIYFKLQLLKSARGSKEYAERLGFARCGEISDVVLEDAREAALKYPSAPIPKLQKIILHADHFDHDIVMVDGDNPIVDIRNDPASVRAYLDRIAGFICDKWNAGLFAKASDTKNGLYDANKYPWHSIRVRDYTPSFNFSGLPAAISQFLKSNRFPKIRDTSAPDVAPKKSL